jgi:hypothetical protein
MQNAKSVSREQVQNDNTALLERIERRRLHLASRQADLELRIQSLLNKADQLKE